MQFSASTGIGVEMKRSLIAGFPYRPILRRQAGCTSPITGFFIPYWDAIFTRDAERKQDREETKATGKVTAKVYARFGHHLNELPMTGIERRADLVAGFLDDV